MYSPNFEIWRELGYVLSKINSSTIGTMQRTAITAIYLQMLYLLVFSFCKELLCLWGLLGLWGLVGLLRGGTLSPAFQFLQVN